MNATFTSTFGTQGVLYGSGVTSDPKEVARVAVPFHLERASISDIATRFLWLKPNQQVAGHERGAEFFVTKSWQELASVIAYKRKNQTNRFSFSWKADSTQIHCPREREPSGID
jgi:hypothetical protein